MYSNGYISVKASEASSFDANGDPVTGGNSTPVPIACFFKTNTSNNKGKYIDGNFHQASYEILIEGKEFEANIITLNDNKDRFLGEFKIQDIEFLEVVKMVKITV